MSYRPTIAVYHGGEIVDIGYYRNWGSLDLLLECAVLACVVDGARSFDEARALVAWYEGRLRDLHDWGAVIKELWEGRDVPGWHDGILADSPYPPEPYDREDLKQFEWHSEDPTIVDASSRCVYHGTRALTEEELGEVPLFDTGPEATEDDIARQLRARRTPFDLLLSEESPVYHALTHAQPRPGEASPQEEPTDPWPPSCEPLPPETDIFDTDRFYWSIRTGNSLRRAGITTIGQLTSMSEQDLLQVRNLGIKGVCEIEDQLAAYGMQIAE